MAVIDGNCPSGRGAAEGVAEALLGLRRRVAESSLGGVLARGRSCRQGYQMTATTGFERGYSKRC